jgi:hypothetical protein
MRGRNKEGRGGFSCVGREGERGGGDGLAERQWKECRDTHEKIDHTQETRRKNDEGRNTGRRRAVKWQSILVCVCVHVFSLRPLVLFLRSFVRSFVRSFLQLLLFFLFFFGFTSQNRLFFFLLLLSLILS